MSSFALCESLMRTLHESARTRACTSVVLDDAEQIAGAPARKNNPALIQSY